MVPGRALKAQKGQALMELLLLAPLFLACVLALLFFAKALNARLTLIHVCRDAALALGRDPDDREPQAVLQALIQRRELQALGHWTATVQAALPADAKAPQGLVDKMLGALVAERLTVTLELRQARWMSLVRGPWTMSESVVFKRGTWKAPYAKAAKSLFDSL